MQFRDKEGQKKENNTTHLPFMAPFDFTRLINSVTTLLGPTSPFSKAEAPLFLYKNPWVHLSVYEASLLHVFQVSIWETDNRQPLTHPTLVSMSFILGHEFLLNISGSNRYTDADLPLGNMKGWLEAPTGVADNLPMAAELISRNPSPWGIVIVDNHKFACSTRWQISLDMDLYFMVKYHKINTVACDVDVLYKFVCVTWWYTLLDEMVYTNR